MRQLTLSKIAIDSPAGNFYGDDSYDLLLDEDSYVTKEDGSPLLCLRKSAISKSSVITAWPFLKMIEEDNLLRGVASGIKDRDYIRDDGSVSRYKSSPKGMGVNSAAIGYMDRSIRFPYCRPCYFNKSHPELIEAIAPLCSDVTGIFSESVPERYAVQRSYVDRTDPAFVIKGSVFTTVTVNKNFRTAAHKDKGDLEAGFSCLTVIREGAFKGGHLILPEYRVACKLDTLDLLMFDAHEYHCNSPIETLTEGATRCSCVFYYREKMVHCLSPEGEYQRAKSRRPGDRVYDP